MEPDVLHDVFCNLILEGGYLFSLDCVLLIPYELIVSCISQFSADMHAIVVPFNGPLDYSPHPEFMSNRLSVALGAFVSIYGLSRCHLQIRNL